jgi:hypothetical protein
MSTAHITRASTRTSTLFAIISVLGLSLQASDTIAASYYVATTGSDTGPGSQSQPWRTIQKAANTVIAGDTVSVAGGIYNEKVVFTRSGTASQKIIFKNVAGQTPIIDGQGLSIPTYDTLISIKGVGYMRLEGFEIKNSAYWVIYIGGESHHLELSSLDIHDGAMSGMFIDGPRSRPAFSLISGNKVHNNGQGGITLWYGTGGYYRIEQNEVYANLGKDNYDGVQIGGGNAGTHHIVVKNNVIHDNGSADAGEDNLDLGGHAINHHYLVEGNKVFGGTGSFKIHSGSIKYGYYTAGVSGYHIARFNVFTGKGYVCYEFPNPVAVYNNTFVDPGQAFMLYNDDAALNKNVGDSTFAGGDAGRMNWKNNVFWQEAPSNANVLLPAGAGSIDLSYRSVRNQYNLYKFSSGQKLVWTTVFAAPVSDAVFTSFKNSNSPNLPETGGVRTTATSGQMFANYATRDYHLVTGSPAIDKGTALTTATNAGTNSTVLKVDRSSYFQDGYCVSGECLNAPDSIVVGNNPAVAIVSVDDANNQITLANSITWPVGASVSLPYSGTAPDIGAYEFVTSTPSSLAPPANLRVLP